MTVRIKRDSRLQLYPLVTVDGYEFWDFEPLAEFPERSDDQRYQVKSGDRPDTIAVAYYGSANLWWVVAVANGLELLPSALFVGQKLRIPDPGFVRQRLFKS